MVSGLGHKTAPIDGSAVQPGGRAGLEPPEPKAKPVKGFGESQRGRFAHPPGRRGVFADMDQTTQEGPGGQDHRATADFLAMGGEDPGDPAPGIEDDVLHRPGTDRKILLGGQDLAHGLLVETAVRLGPGPLHRRPLGPVEHPELDARAVDGPPHDAVQGIDLAHQVALAQPADRRIAGHFADGVDAMGDEQGPGAHARGNGRGFRAGMAAADHDHVEGVSTRCHGRETLPVSGRLSKHIMA